MKSPINVFSPRLPTIYGIQGWAKARGWARSLELNLPPRLGQARGDGPGPGGPVARAWAGPGPGPGPSGSENLKFVTVFIDFYSVD